MIFAALDYWAFRRQVKQYDPSRSDNQLGSLFHRNIPSEVADRLAQGDVVFTSNLRSGLSWMIRYLTRSQLTHVALVTGPGTILDSTLHGTAIRRLTELYGDNVRLAPCHSPLTAEERVGFGIKSLAFLGQRYAKGETIRIGIGALICYYPHYFRWTFLADVFGLLAACDLISIELFRFPIFLWLFFPYTLVVVYLFVSWRLLRRQVTAPFIPDDILKTLKDEGWTVFLNGKAIRESLQRSRGIQVDLPDILEFRSTKNPSAG